MKTMSKILLILMLVCTVVALMPTNVNAAGDPPKDVDIGTLTNTVQDNIHPDQSAATSLAKIAGKVIGLLQVASAIATVILVAVFGFKFIMASPEGKGEYTKSFVPLIVGVIVVFSATSVARLVFSLITNNTNS